MAGRLPPLSSRGAPKKTGRPLPPEPSSVIDVPPPLPSRPAPARPPTTARNGPMSPSTTSEESTDDGEAEYCEAEISVVTTGQQEEPQQELYDECDMKKAESAVSVSPIQEDLYEVPPSDELETEEAYEIMPAAQSPSPGPTHTPPPPPIDSLRMPLPPVSKGRPPMTHIPSQDEPPQLPDRPPGQTKSPGANLCKKMSAGSAAQLGLSADQIGNAMGKLRKVSSSEQKESFDHADGATKEETGSEARSVRDMILKLQKGGEASGGKSALSPSGPKPSLPVRPMLSKGATKTSSPASKALGYVAPTPAPAIKKPDSPPPPPPQQAPQNNTFSEDIYDDALSCLADPLGDFDWYHGDTDRKETEKKLKEVKLDGSFMVRKSAKGGESQPYTLVVMYNDHIYNLKIRCRPDTKVALGEPKPDELAFKDVQGLITHHRNNDVILVNTREKKQYKTLLTKYPKS